MEPKGTVGTVIMSDNAPAKIVTVWPWHYGGPALYMTYIHYAKSILMLIVINYLYCLNPAVPFGSSIDY